MDLAAVLPAWLDALLMAPFRWPASAELGLWLGSAFLALYCTVIGELCAAGLFFLHKKYYLSMQDGMIRYHNISVDALHAGNKEVYKAANKLAHEDFGKTFFAQATIGIASLWPVPFALGWLSLRFEGIDLYAIPGTGLRLGYVFVLLSLYIVIRVTFSLKIKNHIPLFRRIAEIKSQARAARGGVRSFFNPPKDKDENKDSDSRGA